MSRKQLQQIFALVSMVSFFGSTAYGAIGALNSAIKQPSTDTTKAGAASQVQAQAKGYELVLQREPENQVALDGLVRTRLQMKDAQGAIAPLEKLVKLNPSQQEYKLVLAQVKQHVGRRNR